MANWTQQRHLQYERHNNSLHGQPFLPPSQPNKSSTLTSTTTKSRLPTLNNCNNIKFKSFQLSDQHTIPNICTKFYRHNFDSSTVGLLAFTCIITALSHSALGEGNVGCKFVRTLCLDNSEVCYDDNVFGKCIPTTGINVEDIERTPLTEDQSHLLSTMLEEMQGDGLGWDHPYVQCRIQGTLFSLEKQTPLPPNLCANLAPIPKAKDRVGSMASVRFAPPSEPTDYGMNQFYYPPLKKQYFKTNDFNEIFQNDFNDYVDEALPNDVNRFAEFDKNRESQMNQPSGVDVFMRKELDTIRHKNAERKLKAEAQRKAALRHSLKLYQLLADTEPDPQPFLRHRQALDASDSDVLPSVTNFAPSKRKQESVFRELVQQQHVEPKALDSINSNNQPTKAGFESSVRKRLTDTNNSNLDESLLRNSLTPFEEEAILFANIYPNHPKYDDSTHPYEKVFSEGGPFMIDPGDHNIDPSRYNRRKEIAREFFANMLGFIRHERLDVKKPGPLIGPPSLVRGDIEEQQGSQMNTTKEDLPKQHLGSEGEAKKKKKLVVQHSDEDHGPHSVDTEYAHVLVKNSIDNWSDGVRIMNELASILHLQGFLTYLTVQPHEISFRVDSNNPEHRTASDVAQSINENRGVKNNILRRLGVTVVGAGVGDKVKRDDDNGVSASRLELGDKSPNVTSIMIYMFAGAGAAAIVVICITLILISRHDREKREKLTALKAGAMSGGDNCSKDYQELCRARMAKKNSTSEPVSSGRITSLSKENERPPSSRSSTSSWCEEPALTNMDISTGHMVLSYMEDHLRNKGRLQREWEALCRYEAEPNAREMALQPQCSKLNRPGAPLPYDHSRVVLNHLANAEGLDYINASTITDHDPRAPAYIAAQGPLPSTLAHFWQMVWEQGAVVIVALCRLQENGDIACVRYWPEEGAEIYHIYEVHLVSEHIWCDDYLVRSFYLKNLRTSETRTVTQFHFLSWPLGGVPLQAKALLDFRRKVNKSYRGRSCPIVVHGSNGVGRTGAYILLDMVLGRMNKGAREIDIAATLEHLRDQRADLVATRQQFEFVLMAVAEEVHAILKALPANTTNNDKRDLEIRGEQNVLKEEESDENVVKKKQIDKEKENKTAPIKQEGDNKKI